MLIRVDAAKDRPIYAQIADSIRAAVSAGRLVPGEKLPPAGDIAAGLEVNKHTVLHAYQLLRDEGLLDLRRGRGAVVTPLAEEIASLHREAQALAARARLLGIEAETLAAIVAHAHTDAVGTYAADTVGTGAVDTGAVGTATVGAEVGAAVGAAAARNEATLSRKRRTP
ncbi:GntR family transcriptional regulator [Leucobacter soli]|uniref:HTH gntR-type domain-containing protein n=1 Tax=Leucobacter soli TaxID=2812850 RepID=A0A916JUY9_9MICO|nr:GntR family transcriptional regulator [Leucobacter soli]CAG7604734.1 hypothetical protein LEUCIP111803_00758 [Leucobacter soli]